MKDYQQEFLDLAIACEALRFGKFTLKSGRISPYFFNSGLFNTGQRLARLGYFYAQTIVESSVPFDMLYGPAYKGIPLTTATATAFSEHFERDIPYAFNRKEAKKHAEGGLIVGSRLTGKIFIVDDVISAGTSVRESVDIIKSQGAIPTGVAIALDRQEHGTGVLSAVQEVQNLMGLKVVAIANLDTLLAYLQQKNELQEHIRAIETYRLEHGT